MTNVSIIVPTYNEADGISRHLTYHSERFDSEELVVVDGGSTDGTIEAVQNGPEEVTLLRTDEPNRASQMKEGIKQTHSEYLLFLHADTYLPKNFSLNKLQKSEYDWGWFDCRLDENTLKYRVLSYLICLRSSLFSSPTGDQAIWVKRSLLRQIGGIPEQELMEDVELNRRLSEESPGKRFKEPVTTSARRWKRHGFSKTVFTMWSLKLAYFLGVPSSYLSKVYYGQREN